MSAPAIVAFFMVYISSFFLVIGCDDWLMMWIGLEINMVSFIMLMYSRSDMVKSEVSMKYFFIQSIGSAMFMSMFYLDSWWMGLLSPIILIYKMGGAPFYFWFPSICEGSSWMVCFILMTFQKIIPLLLMMMMLGWVLLVLSLMSMMVGGMGSVNQSSMKRLLAYSSIFHVGMVSLSMMMVEKMWVIYLMMYMMVLLGVVMSVKEMEVEGMESVMKQKGGMWFFMGMLSMAGMPPLLGFYLKWMVFYWVLKDEKIILLIVILLSVIMFYVYVRVVYDILMGESVKGMWVSENEMMKMSGVVTLMGMLLGPMGMFVMMW